MREMPGRDSWRVAPAVVLQSVAANLVVAALYVLTARAGSAFSLLMPSAQFWDWWIPIWIPNGITLALVLRFGPRLAPGIWLGSLGLELTGGTSLLLAPLIAAINAAQPVLVAAVLERSGVATTAIFTRTRALFRYLAISIGAICLFSAPLGSLVLGLQGHPRLRPVAGNDGALGARRRRGRARGDAAAADLVAASPLPPGDADRARARHRPRRLSHRLRDLRRRRPGRPSRLSAGRLRPVSGADLVGLPQQADRDHLRLARGRLHRLGGHGRRQRPLRHAGQPGRRSPGTAGLHRGPHPDRPAPHREQRGADGRTGRASGPAALPRPDGRRTHTRTRPQQPAPQGGDRRQAPDRLDSPGPRHGAGDADDAVRRSRPS